VLDRLLYRVERVRFDVAAEADLFYLEARQWHATGEAHEEFFCRQLVLDAGIVCFSDRVSNKRPLELVSVIPIKGVNLLSPYHRNSLMATKLQLVNMLLTCPVRVEAPQFPAAADRVVLPPPEDEDGNVEENEEPE